jgi:hypothetical protein
MLNSVLLINAFEPNITKHKAVSSSIMTVISSDRCQNHLHVESRKTQWHALNGHTSITKTHTSTDLLILLPSMDGKQETEYPKSTCKSSPIQNQNSKTSRPLCIKLQLAPACITRTINFTPSDKTNPSGNVEMQSCLCMIVFTKIRKNHTFQIWNISCL